MPSLPSEGQVPWDSTLDNFLLVSHNADGTLSTSATATALGVYHLKAYGAKGDGVTDDTAAVTAWINAANSAGGGLMLPGPGNFKITSTLPAIATPVRMMGAGPGINFTGPTQFTFAAGVPGLQLAGNSVPNASPTVIEGIALAGSDTSNGQGAVGTNHGISLAANTAHAHGTTLRNLVITGFGGNGIDWEVNTGNAIGSKIDTVRIANCNGHGVCLVGQNVSVTKLTNVDVGNCGLYAFYTNAPGCTFDTCQAAFCSQQAGRTVSDAVTNGTATLTSATASFVATDRGQVVTGTNIPANTSILSVTNSTTVTLNNVASGSGSGGTLTILNGGALYDTTLGSLYLNFYAESGLGSNMNFDVNSAGATFFGGDWSGSWVSGVGAGNAHPAGWSFSTTRGYGNLPAITNNFTLYNGDATGYVASTTNADQIQFQGSGPTLVLKSPLGTFPSLQWINTQGAQLAITGNTSSALFDIKQSGGQLRYRNTNGVNQAILGDTGIWQYASTTGGTNTGTSASALTPSFTNNSAAQLTDVNRDYEVYLVIGTAGSAFSIAIGPTSGVANTVVNSVTPNSGGLYTVRVPAGWFLKWSGTTTTIASQFALSC